MHYYFNLYKKRTLMHSLFQLINAVKGLIIRKLLVWHQKTAAIFICFLSVFPVACCNTNIYNGIYIDKNFAENSCVIRIYTN